jgi:hypothetical protein
MLDRPLGMLANYKPPEVPPTPQRRRQRARIPTRMRRAAFAVEDEVPLQALAEIVQHQGQFIQRIDDHAMCHCKIYKERWFVESPRVTGDAFVCSACKNFREWYIKDQKKNGRQENQIREEDVKYKFSHR